MGNPLVFAWEIPYRGACILLAGYRVKHDLVTKLPSNYYNTNKNKYYLFIILYYLYKYYLYDLTRPIDKNHIEEWMDMKNLEELYQIMEITAVGDMES